MMHAIRITEALSTKWLVVQDDQALGAIGLSAISINGDEVSSAEAGCREIFIRGAFSNVQKVEFRCRAFINID